MNALIIKHIHAIHNTNSLSLKLFTKGIVNKMNYANTRKNRSQTLDFLKGVACIAVVFIHVSFNGFTGDVIRNLSRFAVPCFYMIAGYFALGCSDTVIYRRLVKIIKIFLYALSIWFICCLFVHIFKHDFQSWLMNIFTLKSLLKCIVFCTIDFAIPLWYLVAMIETYFLWFFIIRYDKVNDILKFLPIIFLLQFILTTYVESNNLPWSLKINFITRALPWFLLGYCINKYKNISMSIKDYKLFLYGIIGIVVTHFHIIFKTRIDFSCIGLFIYSTAIFLFAIKYENAKLSNIITYIGNKLSLNVYILHCLVASLLHYINILMFHFSHSIITFFKPVIVVIFTLLLTYIIELFKNNSCKILNNYK